MPCTNMQTAWRYGITEAGKPKYVFKEPKDSWNYEKIKVKCGKCVSCKLSKSSEWATRAYHESLTCGISCFVTLTYAPEHLPRNASLEPNHLRLFHRRLRERFHPEYKIKHLACGEYGHNPKTGDIERPHYHSCIFGFDFLDKEFFYTNKIGQPVYRSKLLEELWTYGHSTVAEMSYETAAYTARYTLKKQTERERYSLVNVDRETGEVMEVEKYERMMKRQGKVPEFIRMSKGIGLDWWKLYKGDTDKDYIMVKGKKKPIPRYYDKKREEIDPEHVKKVKERRVEQAKENKQEYTKSRQQSKSKIANQVNNYLQRGYDNGST